jgi:hypothetical protein
MCGFPCRHKKMESGLKQNSTKLFHSDPFLSLALVFPSAEVGVRGEPQQNRPQDSVDGFENRGVVARVGRNSDSVLRRTVSSSGDRNKPLVCFLMTAFGLWLWGWFL